MNFFYLGFHLPEGLVRKLPHLDGAGQLWETRFLQNLEIGFGVRKASILDRRIKLTEANHKDPKHLLLAARFGKDLQAYPSFCELRKRYLRWRRQGWKPDFCILYNTHPIGNAFTRFLAKHDPDVKRVLFFLDSKNFGKKLPLFKRVRLKLKPLHWRDETMLPYFHGVAAASFSSEKFCRERNIPWHWFPGGAQADGLLDKIVTPATGGNKRVGYFGSHSEYAGLGDLLAAFQNNPELPLTLSIAGEGVQTAELRQRTASDPRIEWVGFFEKRSDLGRWASSCHVLVNPRPSGYGNTNNFPSKLFDYMQLGRSVLSSTSPTLEHAFGDALIWYDAESPRGLEQTLFDVSEKSAADLMHKGEELRQKYAKAYAWDNTVENLQKWIFSL